MRATDARGSAAVELALVLPLLLVVALALVQVGLIGKDQLLTVNGAREGSREAAVTLDESRVRTAATRHGLPPDRTEVEIERSGGMGDPVLVRVRYRARLVVPFLEWLFPDEVLLTAAVTMRQESDA